MSTQTTVIQPNYQRVMRVVWWILLALIMAQLPIRIPNYLINCGCSPSFVQVWESEGIAQTVRGIFTLTAIIQIAFSIGLSALLMWRRGGDSVAVLFAFIFLGVVNGAVPAKDAIPGVGWYILQNISEYFYFTCFGAIIYLFPDAKFSPKPMRWLFYGMVIATLTTFLPSDHPINNLGANITSGLILLGGVWTVIWRYRNVNSPTQRQQLKFFLAFLVVAVAIATVQFFLIPLLGLSFHDFALLDILFGMLTRFLAGGVLFSIALAILRYRLFDIDLVLNRSLVGGAVTLTLGLLFVGIFLLLERVLSSFIGDMQNTLSAGIAGATCVILYNPVRKQVREVIDRRLYGFRFNLDELAKGEPKPAIVNPGQFTGQIFGGYELLGVLGRGGMGEVYKGYANGQQVAVKLLLPDLNNADFVARFHREIETLRRLSHPHIIRLVEGGEHEQVVYMVMEFINGKELKDVIPVEGLDTENMRDILMDLGSALTLVHQHGITHRDLKPSNIMIKIEDGGETLYPVLMDFGIAHIHDTDTELTGTGAIGTIDYMSPEQILESRDIDHRADIYALGIMLYEMCTGERPYKGSAGQILFAHLQQPPPNPCDKKPALPTHIGDAIQKAMEKDPQERFQSVQELLQAIA